MLAVHISYFISFASLVPRLSPALAATAMIYPPPIFHGGKRADCSHPLLRARPLHLAC